MRGHQSAPPYKESFDEVGDLVSYPVTDVILEAHTRDAICLVGSRKEVMLCWHLHNKRFNEIVKVTKNKMSYYITHHFCHF